MKFRFKKLNSQGFAHHLLIPIAAIVIVAGIGTYIITKSHAMVPPTNGSWHTVASTGSISQSIKGSTKKMYLSTYVVPTNSIYRACLNAKSSTSQSVSAISIGYENTQSTFNTTSKRVCTPQGTQSPQGMHGATVTVWNGTLVVQKVDIQRYY